MYVVWGVGLKTELWECTFYHVIYWCLFLDAFALLRWGIYKVKKVKCTLVQALRLCTGHTAHRGSRGIALPFHDHGTRRR